VQISARTHEAGSLPTMAGEKETLGPWRLTTGRNEEPIVARSQFHGFAKTDQSQHELEKEMLRRYGKEGRNQADSIKRDRAKGEGIRGGL